MKTQKFISKSLLITTFAMAASAYASGGKAPQPPTDSNAQPTIDASVLANGGTGCAGSNSITTTGGGAALAVSFSAFNPQTDGNSTLSRQTCALALPVEIPAGWQLVVDKLTVKGEARLQAGSSLKLRLDVFTAGTKGPSLETDLGANQNGPFEVTLDAARDAASDSVLATACGPLGANVRVNLSATLVGPQSSATINSVGDATNQALLGFKWRRCP